MGQKPGMRQEPWGVHDPGRGSILLGDMSLEYCRRLEGCKSLGMCRHQEGDRSMGGLKA